VSRAPYDILVSSKSEKGRRRANEDACLALTSEELGGGIEGLFIVADGMGGRASGALASTLAVNTVRDAFVSGIGRGTDNLAEVLSESLRAANDAVYREANSKPELQGMGTTCAVVAVRDGQVFFAHMGDSRAYLLREGRLRRLTEDHSIVAEKVKTGELTEDQARKSRFRNVITRAIGLEPDAQPAVGSTELQPGDVLLLCTDGLTTPVSDAEIADILCSSSEPEEACDRLVKTALRNGGADNVTVVVAAYGAQPVTAARGRVTRTRRIASWILPALVGLALGIGIGLYPGRMLLPGAGKPLVRKQSPALSQPDLARATYEDPVSLLYVPLQGSFLALDASGYLHVVDRQGRLMRVDTSGRILYTFPARDAFKPAAQTRSPMAATDRESNLYISDPAGRRIVKFGPDGLFLGSIGEAKLSAPEALAVGADGSIYVVDNGRLKAIRPKSSQPPAARP